MELIPPVLPNLQEQIESYLITPESLPMHDAKYSSKFCPRVPNPQRLFTVCTNTLKGKLEVERHPKTGTIIGVKESSFFDVGYNARNSFSLSRNPCPPEETVRGSSKNFPFWPGGIDKLHAVIDDVDNSDLCNKGTYLTKHPLLSGGIDFNEVKCSEHKIGGIRELETLNIAEMLKVDKTVLNLIEEKGEICSAQKQIEVNVQEGNVVNVDFTSAIKDDIIKISEGSLRGKIIAKGTEWARVIDVNDPVLDFESKVPYPACKYPFKLDTFQKQAILQIENRNFIFVAAHTSAGKTVVAEYAIALCLKHMTRAIYTSPIKALSNQKYRELKHKFGDVGLLTGDIQINVKASCLIMTTEILQSMLYNGSDLIRDLEWVIFDEVHYINNADRGHVWEEVIIMLPSHVSIVLLSATVPNTVEFSDWIGRIKKRKIYVISTLKRPVPLEHFLYTGTGGKSKDERFLIVNSDGNLVKQGYISAFAAKKLREKKTQQGPRQGNVHHLGEKQETNMWIGLLDHLKRNDLLPVVAFTLSRKRCDLNATLLLSQDLTSSREKNEINIFIKRCIDRLKDTDKNLPQVVHMKTLLTKGIGVHHSGILPILKEVVEMLFAMGLVKLLFATETFAMGVNMPARSVVFDSIRKHDGTRFRDLLPSEYIQMAGRAGRRGIDDTGTVIILCKVDVPEISDLYKMMLGKPTKLESQFKLTYSMILNLLRVELFRVEDMMKRSFSESLQLINHSKYESELVRYKHALEAAPDLECMMCVKIEEFYGIARDYVNHRNYVHKNIFTQQYSRKMMQPGRVVIIAHDVYQNSIACIVKTDIRNLDKFVVFVLKSEDMQEMSADKVLAESCLSAAYGEVKFLQNTSSHNILNITCKDIVNITKKLLKIDGDNIIDNVKKREMPRFKDESPSKSVLGLINELQRINEGGSEMLEIVDIMKDLHIKELTTVEQMIKLKDYKAKLQLQQCMECPQFHEHFRLSFQKLKLSENVGRLNYLMSEESLQLHPEYQSRIDVLKSLGYIEDNKTVTLKGRVACEMGNHELMITELFLDNVFAEKTVEEICALLSSLVYQGSSNRDGSLPEELKKGEKQFKSVAKKIGKIQKQCGLSEPVGDFVDQFNFGLAEVVYHWAFGKPFKDIMELTDVQEGITVKCIQRLDETFRDVKDAARIIGDPDMYVVMEKASTAIKRDIVFAASLYTQ